MNKLAHYLNFMGKARAYGLTKEAADDLYKEAAPTLLARIGRAALRPARNLVEPYYSELGREAARAAGQLGKMRAGLAMSMRSGDEWERAKALINYGTPRQRRELMNKVRDSLKKHERFFEDGHPRRRETWVSSYLDRP